MSRAASSFLLEILPASKRELEASLVLISVREKAARPQSQNNIVHNLFFHTVCLCRFCLIVLPYIFMIPHLQVNFNTLSIHPRAIYAYNASGDIPLPGYRRLPYALSPNRRAELLVFDRSPARFANTLTLQINLFKAFCGDPICQWNKYAVADDPGN